MVIMDQFKYMDHLTAARNKIIQLNMENEKLKAENEKLKKDKDPIMLDVNHTLLEENEELKSKIKMLEVNDKSKEKNEKSENLVEENEKLKKTFKILDDNLNNFNRQLQIKQDIINSLIYVITESKYKIKEFSSNDIIEQINKDSIIEIADLHIKIHKLEVGYNNLKEENNNLEKIKIKYIEKYNTALKCYNNHTKTIKELEDICNKGSVPIFTYISNVCKEALNKDIIFDIST